MMPAAFLPPSEQQRRTLAALSLVERDDKDPSYVRYAHVTGRFGVVYAPAMPLAWGFYFGSPPVDLQGMLWARNLDAIAALIVWANRMRG